jgi:hypothetical protein
MANGDGAEIGLPRGDIGGVSTEEGIRLSLITTREDRIVGSDQFLSVRISILSIAQLVYARWRLRRAGTAA